MSFMNDCIFNFLNNRKNARTETYSLRKYYNSSFPTISLVDNKPQAA